MIEALFLEEMRKIAPAIRVVISASARNFMVQSGATTPEQISALGKNTATGVGTLRKVTGQLARSINDARNPEHIFEIEAANNILTITAGSRRPYAAINEYGGTGTRQIPAHTRRITGGKTVSIDSYSQNYNHPARPYFTPNIEKEWSNIEKMVYQAYFTAAERAVAAL